jgi:hypothetical protein
MMPSIGKQAPVPGCSGETLVPGPAKVVEEGRGQHSQWVRAPTWSLSVSGPLQDEWTVNGLIGVSVKSIAFTYFHNPLKNRGQERWGSTPSVL